MLLRFTQAFDPHVLCDRPELARDLMVDRGGLRTLPGQENIPVVVDHNMDRRIGVVREMFTDMDTDGRRWNFASVTLDPNPPEWLKRGTPVSWSYKAFGTREAAWGSGIEHITDAFILEISVLLSKKPAEPLARVLWIDRESPAASSTSNAAGEQVIYGDGTLVRGTSLTPCSRSAAGPCERAQGKRSAARVATT